MRVRKKHDRTESEAIATLESVPQIIRRVARSPANCYGKNFVFLAPVFDAMRVPRRDAQEVLLTLHRASKIVLARADLVPAMDPALVKGSALQLVSGSYVVAEFHFIDLRYPFEK